MSVFPAVAFGLLVVTPPLLAGIMLGEHNQAKRERAREEMIWRQCESLREVFPTRLPKERMNDCLESAFRSRLEK